MAQQEPTELSALVMSGLGAIVPVTYRCGHCRDHVCTAIPQACRGCNHPHGLSTISACINCRWNYIMRDNGIKVCPLGAYDMMFAAMKMMYRNYTELINGEDIHTEMMWVIWRALSFIDENIQEDCLRMASDVSSDQALREMISDVELGYIRFDECRSLLDIRYTFDVEIPQMLGLMSRDT